MRTSNAVYYLRNNVDGSIGGVSNVKGDPQLSDKNRIGND